MADDTQKLIRPVAKNEAGSVVVDNRGRNIWQWKDEQLDSTSIVLKRLENDALELESTRKVPVAKKGVADKSSERRGRGKPERSEPGLSICEEIDYDAGGGGFDPYNRS